MFLKINLKWEKKISYAILLCNIVIRGEKMVNYFSKALKAFRQEQGLTMQELADRAHVSKSMICKIERNEVQPTLDVAHKLAHALGKALSEFLSAPQTDRIVHLTRDQQAIWEDADHIKRRILSPVFEGLKLEWLHVIFPIGKKVMKMGSVNTLGKRLEKYVLVTKGTLQININNNSYNLQSGDSFYFDTSFDHEFANIGKTLLEFYVIIKHE